MSTFKSTNRKKNFANPSGSLPDPCAHKQTKSLYNIDMSYYYRKPNKDNYGDDIRNLINKIDIVYTSLEYIIEERNDLLQLFNSRINDNIPNENIDVNADNRFKLI